jgi:hypothetical protein
MKKIFRKGALCVVLAVLFFAACNNGTTDGEESGEKSITKFSLDVKGELVNINEAAARITVTVPSGTSINALTPAISMSAGASADKTGPQDFTSEVTYTITAEDGTTQNYTVAVSVRHELAYTVWAGDTPQAGNTGWLTISFLELESAIKGSDDIGYRAIAAFSADNSTNNWGYTYDSAARSGTLPGAGGWLGGGAFTISADYKTLTFTSFMGSARNFRRLRAKDLTIDSVPFTPGDLPGDLVNSVWAGETPRQGDWLTMTFKNLAEPLDEEKAPEKTGQRVICSFSADNSTNDWGYDYDSTKKAGTITTGSPWSPAPDGFTVSADGKTLTIPNYGGHGEGLAFSRLR